MAASKDLAEILRQRDPSKYKAIIDRAELNGYHDHKFDSIPGHPEYAEDICPKMKLVSDLSAFDELKDLVQKVMDGEYDDPADTEDQEEMRGWLMDDNSPDGMFKALGFAIPTQQERQQRKNGKELN